jgi:hypothetical protein
MTAQQEVVQHEKVGSNTQHVIHKNAPRQNTVPQQNAAKKPVHGELKMKKSNWKKAQKFAIYLLANFAVVAMLKTGVSVAP